MTLLLKTLKPINWYHCVTHSDTSVAFIDQDQILQYS